MKIPFNRSAILGEELAYIAETMRNGQVSGDQQFSKKSQDFLRTLLGVKSALVSSSCTHALEMSALLLNIKPGDEVVVPSFTFVSTANAFALRGAKIVFCDIRPDTLNMDEKLLAGLITPVTRAILPVHYAGVACEMDEIMRIAGQKSVPVIEDNAHGLFGKYRGKWLGTFGCMAAQSFHETKNITCGEGGALLINDAKFIERAEVIREKGTNRAKFFRGMVDKYGWVDIGSSYVMSDVLAAFLFGQLEKWREVQLKRKEIWERYDAGLKSWCQTNGVRQPVVPPECEQAYHMYYLLFPSLKSRTAMIVNLMKNGISAVFHYLPLNISPMGRSFGGREGMCPVTEDISDRLLRLPFYNTFSESEQSAVIESITRIGL